MQLMAVTFQILPGKTPAWRRWTAELNGPRQEEFATSRERAGVRERTFLQETPQGDVVIVTLEGEDPARAFEKMMEASDPFTTWFLERVKEFHGIDLAKSAMPEPPSLVVDSAAVPVAAR